MNKKIVIYSTIVILLVAAVVLISKIAHKADTNEITLKDTPTVIEATRPIGILYLYTTVTEDYAKDAFYGSGIGSSLLGKDNGLFKRKHDCVQILRQQVNLTMDMDKVQYQPIEGTDSVKVCLPNVEFTQSTLSSWFKSDSEAEENAVQFDAKPLIQRVERKIENRYNTPENRIKAEEKAKETITDFLKQCGKVAVFV
ncbi:MAG: DUF4230 domain-containing protein [Bacteroidales bacterium]|jgi:hypothetical protein|nr:DUF4230 domain-containing protein [Bacteroidales bacterium]